jgi:Uma2 family endonuclease
MSSISRYTPHYTVADYEQWRGDWELWDGHAISMSPSPSIRHQRVAGRLYLAITEQLNNHDACHCEVLYEVDWRVKEDTVLRPDLLIVCEPVTTTWVETTPTLTIEIVSPGTEKNDRQFKRARYAELGVAYYLIVDPKSKQVETLVLDEGAYRPADPVDLKLHDGCSLRLDTSAIWG